MWRGPYDNCILCGGKLHSNGFGSCDKCLYAISVITHFCTNCNILIAYRRNDRERITKRKTIYELCDLCVDHEETQ